MLSRRELLLTEGAIRERLNRNPRIVLDPVVAHTSLLYSEDGVAVLSGIWREYLEIGRAEGLGMLVCTPTRRAIPEYLASAGLPCVDEVARDAVSLLKRLRSEYAEYAEQVFVGGLMGCRGNAYDPREALDSASAARFHREQAEALAQAGADFLMAATLPAFSEALGLAQAMARTGCPYIISFVLRPTGTLLDGTHIGDAIARIDAAADPSPAAFLANCVHPANVHLALENAVSVCPGIGERLVGVQGNTSRKSPEELDNAAELDTDDPEQYAAAMMALREDFGMHILGGCCGTDHRHMAAVARRLRQKTAVCSQR
jgi:homocysteine S-methyltransferase